MATAQEISLLPNTGVQFVFLEKLFSERDMTNVESQWQYQVKHAEVDPDIKPSTGDVGASSGGGLGGGGGFGGFGGLGDALGGMGGGSGGGPETVVVAASMKVAMDMARADGSWIPLPFNATTSLWTKLWIGAKDSNGYFDCCLAVDTTATANGEGGTLAESCLPGKFRVEPVTMKAFWQSQPVMDYVDRHYRRRLEDQDLNNTGERPSDENRGAIQAHLAGFYQFLLDRPGMPVIQMDAKGVQEAVDVSLVVDFGNSRTCAILRQMEQMPGQPQFRVLEMRNLRKPTDVLRDPFTTYMAFVPPDHGVLEGAMTFKDLSIVRMGKHAMDLLGQADGDTGVRGMSSPKRYLWEADLPADPWQLATADGRAGEAQVIRGEVLRRLDPQNLLKNPEFPEEKVVNPIYPRKAGVIFAFIEMLEQAYRQINSVEYRGARNQMAGYRRRRIIRNLVLMHPAGMHRHEAYDFIQLVKRAARLWAEFRNDMPAFVQGLEAQINPKTGVPVPNVIVSCDEGLSVQICYLFGETKYRYGDRTDLLVGTAGYDPNAGKAGAPAAGAVAAKKRIRIASIDIGGGTVDLAVADYTPRPGVVPGYGVEKIFHDGMPVAGDDIAKELLQLLVFPAVCQQMGLKADQWNQLFGATGLGPVENWPVIRRRLITTLWMPLAYGCLRRIEEGKDVDATVNQLLEVVNQGSVHRINQAIAQYAQPDPSVPDLISDVMKVRLQFSERDVLSVVRRAIGTCLEQYCDIISQFRANVLVVAGRPSGLPPVRQLIMEKLPVAPGNVVFMHQQEIGDWYPFTGKGGKVADSKTTSVVGAAMAFAATFGGSGFSLSLPPDIIGLLMAQAEGTATQQQTQQVTILEKNRYLMDVYGVFDERFGLLRTDFELFQSDPTTGRPNQLAQSNEVPFENNPILIGFRRVDHPYALARPVYRIALKREIQKCLSRHPVPNNPVYVRLAPAQRLFFPLMFQSVRGPFQFFDDAEQLQTRNNDPEIFHYVPLPNAGRMERWLPLQTMVKNEYWLDSGTFDELVAPEQ